MWFMGHERKRLSMKESHLRGAEIIRLLGIYLTNLTTPSLHITLIYFCLLISNTQHLQTFSHMLYTLHLLTQHLLKLEKFNSISRAIAIRSFSGTASSIRPSNQITPGSKSSSTIKLIKGEHTRIINSIHNPIGANLTKSTL
jgi:hypothetical protein